MPPRHRTHAALLFLILHVPAAGAQWTVTDDLHRVVALPGPAQRIVSLAPSITESLFAIGAGNQIVGVTDYCNYPPGVAGKSRVGGMITPSVETIVSLTPDMLVVSMEGNQRADFLRLVDLGIPVVVTNPRTLEDIFHSLAVLGILTGRTREADSVSAGLRTRTRLLAEGAADPPQRVLMFVSVQPLIAVGGGTFLNELLTRAGAVNLAGLTAMTYPAYSREAVIADDPDVVLVLSDALPSLDRLTLLFPEWSRLTALRKGRVHLVNADMVSRPGPRAVDGLELLVSLIRTDHP